MRYIFKSSADRKAAGMAQESGAAIKVIELTIF